MADSEQLRRSVAISNVILDEIGLATGITSAFGHVSARDPDNPEQFWVKGRGYDIDALVRMRPDDMVLCDLEGRKIGGPEGITVCFEVKIHSCIYASRPDVMSVVHVHPQYTILAGVLQLDLVPMGGAGSALFEQPVPIYHHTGLVASEEQGAELAEVLGAGSFALMEGHGAVAVGPSMEFAVSTMWQLEYQAQMNYLAYSTLGPNHRRLPQTLIDEARGQPPFWKLPHFSDHWQDVRVRPAGGVSGAWGHLVDLVEGRFEAEA